ncbi:large ribosomal subunit protein eL28-like [Oscarella lobularis]|uniref:large ribosomal subunit protein eL28-like n=1 Tax=Oscarella lobularis TaxID=121494 RepID=UPI0033135B01
MSADLQWLAIRNSSSFLIRQKQKTFSTEPQNLMGINSYKYNGLVNKRAIGIEAAKDNKGAVMTLKTRKAKNKPASGRATFQLVRGPRRAVKAIKKTCITHHYRPDLADTAVRRVCAIYRSQKPVASVQKKRSRRKRTD